MSGSVRSKADMGLLVIQLDQSGMAAPVRVEQQVMCHRLSPFLFRRIRRRAGIMVQRLQNGQVRTRTDKAEIFGTAKPTNFEATMLLQFPKRPAVSVSVRGCPFSKSSSFRVGIAAETRDRV